MAIEVFQENDLDIDVTITDETGTAVDLTGATLDYQLSDNSTDETALLSLSTSTSGITVTSAADGEATITLSNTDTDRAPGCYVQALRLTTSGGEIYDTSLDSELIIKDSIFTSD